MYAQITQMRYHGKALDQHQIIRSAPGVWGDIIVSHENVAVLGRYSDVAKVGGGQGGEAALPALYDVRLAQHVDEWFRLIGPSTRRVDSVRPVVVVPAGLSEGAGPSPIRF